MSLLLIFEKLWRYKFFTLPILLLTIGFAGYEAVGTPSVYQASTSYILVNPPSPPTADEIAQNPKLGRGASNPYTRYSDQSIIVQILAARLNSDDTRLKLYKQGVDPRYEVAPDVSFGFTAPVVQITGLAATPPAAVKTARSVGKALTDELSRMQAIQGVATTYRISAQQIVDVGAPQMKATGKLRSMIGVLVFGTIVLFIIISVLDAISALRQRRNAPPVAEEAVGLRLATPTSGPIRAPAAAAGPVERAVPPPPPATRGPSAWDGPLSAEPSSKKAKRAHD